MRGGAIFNVGKLTVNATLRLANMGPVVLYIQLIIQFVTLQEVLFYIIQLNFLVGPFLLTRQKWCRFSCHCLNTIQLNLEMEGLYH